MPTALRSFLESYGLIAGAAASTIALAIYASQLLATARREITRIRTNHAEAEIRYSKIGAEQNNNAKIDFFILVSIRNAIDARLENNLAHCATWTGLGMLFVNHVSVSSETVLLGIPVSAWYGLEFILLSVLFFVLLYAWSKFAAARLKLIENYEEAYRQHESIKPLYEDRASKI